MHLHWNKLRADKCPCVGCVHQQDCSTHMKVCVQFTDYVNGDAIRAGEKIPTKELYMQELETLLGEVI